MKKIIRRCTRMVSTKKGMYITLALWFLLAGFLTIAPSSKEYETTNMEILPEEAQSVIAKKQIEKHFPGDNTLTALLVFHNPNGKIDFEAAADVLTQIEVADIDGISTIPPFTTMPIQAQQQFASENLSTILIPIQLDGNLESSEVRAVVEKLIAIGGKDASNYMFRVTGPAGIATDTLALFSQADMFLMMATVALILILLIVIYRSPLLALIPLVASGIVYLVADKIIGLLGKGGLVISNETLSIMMILLFAAVTDYSLFVFSRYREELKQTENRFEAMKQALHEVGMPVFFSGGTVLVAMLILFFTKYQSYHNFAPIFAVTMAVIMLASITLIPALFALFGRKAFWPKIPKVGDPVIKEGSIWSRMAGAITHKPIVSFLFVVIILLLSSGNIFNIQYEFDTVKTFPNDMPSREGYEMVEQNFDKGTLAPTTILLESTHAVTEEQAEALRSILENQPHVASVSLVEQTKFHENLLYELVFDINPYSKEAIDTIEHFLDHQNEWLHAQNILGTLYFAGITADLYDENTYSNRDLVVVMILESLFIFAMLIALTKSIRLPIYMVGTILFSFAAALGLGTFLVDILFGHTAISIRVPLYAFVFLVALGVDYNIIIISRFIEERKQHSVQKAMEIALSHTGSVISSAGLILAGTFAVLMTQPISILFVFGFIVALGILLDTFLVRSVLLPTLVILLEKKEKTKQISA